LPNYSKFNKILPVFQVEFWWVCGQNGNVGKETANSGKNLVSIPLIFLK
jgi:hypothetical protein